MNQTKSTLHSSKSNCISPIRQYWRLIEAAEAMISKTVTTTLAPITGGRFEVELISNMYANFSNKSAEHSTLHWLTLTRWYPGEIASELGKVISVQQSVGVLTGNAKLTRPIKDNLLHMVEDLAIETADEIAIYALQAFMLVKRGDLSGIFKIGPRLINRRKRHRMKKWKPDDAISFFNHISREHASRGKFPTHGWTGNHQRS